MAVSFSYPKKRSKTVSFNAFDLGADSRIASELAPWRAADSYNFKLFDGALKDSFGVKELKWDAFDGTLKEITGEVIKKAFYYKLFDDAENLRDDRLLALCESGNLYEAKLNSGSGYELIRSGVPLSATGVNYRFNDRDAFVLSEDGSLAVYDGEEFSVHEAPRITSMCTHGERLFVTTGGEKTTLWFSDNFDPTNWYVSLDEAGFIDFRDGLGQVNKVIEFDGRVYIFRDVGVNRLQGYMKQQDFYVESVSVPREKIFASTVTDCGKNIVYLTGGGFYSFDGYNAVRILPELKGYIAGVDNETSHGAYHNGSFYCSFRLKIGGKVENRILCYNVADGSYYLVKGFSVDEMLHVVEIGDKLLFVTEGKLGEMSDTAKYFGKTLKKRWVNNAGNFGIAKVKTLKKIELVSKGDCEVTISSDFGERKLAIDGSRAARSVSVGLKGNEFSIAFESRTVGAEISDVDLVFAY